MPDLEIFVSTTPFSNGSNFEPRNTESPVAGNVKLIVPSGGGTIPVYTYMEDSPDSWVLTDVFDGDQPAPYDATVAGKPYKLKSEIRGVVLISRSSDGPRILPAAPTNGTINVGGGGKDEPGDGEEPRGGGAPR